MKSQEELEAKLKEVKQMMRDNIPNEEDIKQLRDYVQGVKDKTISNDKRMEILVKVMSRPPEVISLDAQLYLLKWMLAD